ncbi:hypothetical protein RclHR1_02520003 [Rhizophagus clarus]|uniref:F-box domain-containing protein n=1 Tax=Rhizophagus clarus TaxID=94130 RepID=A0A2Z6RTT6_9GLOM|nr:hypothetical protein RclHR1_02520003 [Rhizophagus clarus]GES72769.1 hypothetical protein GLOIN_2v1771889 [Rhizophagus clarus]
MACSKIFSGDLPELIYEVVKYFQNDFSTLHSCVLVNRLWCRLAIPILWENPFSIPTENYNFIEVYLCNLSDDLKTKLNEYKINLNLLSSNTLFNYPSFIKYLNTREFVYSIKKWTEGAITTGNICFLQGVDLWPAEKLIYMSLFKIIIENEISLQTLEIGHSSYNSYLDDILGLMLQNPNFIKNIKNLNLHTHYLLYYNSNKYASFINRVSQIINSHQNLKKIILCYKSFPLYKPLLLSKDSNCSNSLNTLMLYRVNFKNIIDIDKVFEQLNVLESVHIVYCHSFDTHFIQQIINLTKPFKLKSLFVTKISQIKPFQSLLQKSGNYIVNFGIKFFGLSLEQQLIELIIEYCKNIKFLDIYEYENQVIHLVLNLIENIKQSLNHLSIYAGEISSHENDTFIERSSTILRNLGQILPLKLEYLSLTLNICVNDFEIFLTNSQNTFINKLLINNIEGQDILPYMKEYIMKKKRVKYLAIMNCFESTMSDDDEIYNNKELILLENEVKEFKLYNIKVQRYYDLSIGRSKLIKELV